MSQTVSPVNSGFLRSLRGGNMRGVEDTWSFYLFREKLIFFLSKMKDNVNINININLIILI